MVRPPQLAGRTWQYQPSAPFWDEAVDAQGLPRPHWRRFAESLEQMGAGEFERRLQGARQIIRNNAVTYNVYGDPYGSERLWPLDPVPLIIAEQEWSFLEAAISQRTRLLNAILNDCYGSQSLIEQHRLPPELVFANPSFLRPCHGVPVPRDIRLHFHAVDLARSGDGRWWVIADRAQVPSGGGYALENRLVSVRSLPNIFNRHSIRPLNHFFSARRHGLLTLAPGHRRMVLLTPGPLNETYFEHSYLARAFGVPLVEGADLTVRDDCVYLKTLEGLEQVDLILRRQDDAYCDPLELRGESLLGIPGLLRAVRAGNVAVANSLGSGLVETPAHKAFLPGLCRHLLGEDLKMPSVATWWCGQPRERRYVLEHLPELIIKPTFPRYGHGPVFGPSLDRAALDELAARIRTRPEQYVAQEVVALSTAPVWCDQQLAQRHVMLRAYCAWDGEGYTVMPGGLTRVSNAPESAIVSMQEGAASKDTWVLGRMDDSAYPRMAFESDPAAEERPSVSPQLPSRVADNLFWLGRYTERVEWMIRVLRAAVPSLLGEEDFTHQIKLESVLRLLVGYGHMPEWMLNAAVPKQLQQLEAVLGSMIHDPAGISGLGWNLKQIRRVAWPIKERLSTDTWRVLQQLGDGAAGSSASFVRHRPAAMLANLDQAISALAAFAGLLSDSTTRGHGWRFLEIGRRIERGLQIAELLRHGLAGSVPDESSMVLVLQIADSTITYRNRHLTALRVAPVLELLLADETNPRSAGFQLATLAELLERLPRDAPSAPHIEKALAAKTLGALRLVNVRSLARPAALKVFLNGLRGDLYDLSEALTGRYLTHVMPSRLKSL